MSLNTRESLSALMDGESEELELRRVLKSLPEEAGAAESWRRYHLARSMMQRERSVDVSLDLSAGIMARLENEPAPQLDAQQDTSSIGSLAKPGRVSFARGASVAAAVSLMVVTGVQFLNSDGSVSTATQGGSDLAAVSSNAGAQVQPASLGGTNAVASSDVPMFEPTAFRVNGQAGRSGLMNVSESFGASTPAVSNAAQTFSAPTSAIDADQINLLQSYLEQHAQGAAAGSGDSWMPLMRSSSIVEPLGQR
ncbi:sigma-E factor negative regulatory protein [Halomonas sp. GD1P12]|uniref:sigma-E factor negative regulatory protein n=1 Tax=Halomonas sp. GD1P12 TaxID=2982691 RepID=UPI0021E45980|nr:sigma-E factor negative regulatory protein [Halomonas sp. GD1P12]UYG01461.1 sigma-E factor negative regulatory protein [Halomonas sp. GD1P12]